MTSEELLASVSDDRFTDVLFHCERSDWPMTKAACHDLLAAVTAYNETQSMACSDLLFEALDAVQAAFDAAQTQQISELFDL